jgi:hypothetical protein
MKDERDLHRISIWWKYGGDTFRRKFNNVILNLNYLTFKWNRKMFMEDSFIVPFNKNIICKLLPHRYLKSYAGESTFNSSGVVIILNVRQENYYCSRCHKNITNEEYNNIARRKKLLRIKKKI